MAILSDADLKQAKAEAKKRFGHIQGIVGFGIGDGVVVIYVRNSAAKNELPVAIDHVPIECVISGDLKSFAETA